MEYVSLIWHTTHTNQKSVGDSVRAVCGDKLHVRFGRGRLMLLSDQDLASYLTSWKSRSTREIGKSGRRAKGGRRNMPERQGVGRPRNV
jgi:hypothetical protein